MDGENRGFVKRHKRVCQAFLRLFQVGIGFKKFLELEQEFFVLKGIEQMRGDGIACFTHAGPDAIAQFRGGGFGERQDEDLADLQPLLDQEKQKPARDRVGFAHSGARLDQFKGHGASFLLLVEVCCHHPLPCLHRDGPGKHDELIVESVLA
jgi:hypothetical protein